MHVRYGLLLILCIGTACAQDGLQDNASQASVVDVLKTIIVQQSEQARRHDELVSDLKTIIVQQSQQSQRHNELVSDLTTIIAQQSQQCRRHDESVEHMCERLLEQNREVIERMENVTSTIHHELHQLLQEPSDIRVYVVYRDNSIAGYNDAWADDTSSVRACMDDCIRKGVRNLRSIDYNKDGTSCPCQPVNLNDVPMTATNQWDTYQYQGTLARARLYVCDEANRFPQEGEPYCNHQNGVAFSDRVLIVEEGQYPSPSRQPVSSVSGCASLCLADDSCNAYVIEEAKEGFYCSIFNNLQV